MNTACVLLVGVLCALVANVPSVVLFELALKRGTSRYVSVGFGLASTFASFATLSAVILAVHVVNEGATLAFGCALIATFLAVWGIESIRGWRGAQVQSLARGKDE